jgi:hypothetical protein
MVHRQAQGAGGLPQHYKGHRRQHQVQGFTQWHGAKFAAVHAALQDTFEHRVAGFIYFVAVERGQFRKMCRLGPHQAADAAGLGAGDLLPPDFECPGQQGGAAALVAVQLQLPVGVAADAVAHHGLEQFFLAGKVQKQRALGHASAGGHGLHAGGGIAFFRNRDSAASSSSPGRASLRRLRRGASVLLSGMGG